MQTTYAGGYYYRGQSVTKKSVRSNRSRIARIIVFMALITVSVLFGAMMHAYATSADQAVLEVDTKANTDANGEDAAILQEPAYIPYSVERGDSLWTIAKRYLPADMDIRNYINEIKAMNSLNSSMLQEGQLLQIPVIR
jgi:LysM repeat protein